MTRFGRPILIALVVVALVIGWTVHRIEEQGSRDERRSADAIVILGAAQYDGRPSPVFEARIRHAVELYQAGIAPILIVTGGKEPGDRTTEAAAARAWAEAHGVPASAILAEDEGRSTLESLRSVAAIMRTHGLSSAVFVSDRTHMLRVLRIAIDQGISAWGSPTTTSPTDGDLGSHAEATIHELGALAVYFVSGASQAADAVATP
jgi:uncharacterized SAM-binding protein YcdF (DUF218 family)